MPEPDTLAIHGGADPHPKTGTVPAPPHQATTFAQEDVGDPAGFTYSRSANPTVAALESALASVAGGMGAAAFSSGMAAIDALLRARADAGDHVVLSEPIYGGTTRLVRDHLSRHGIEASFVPAHEPGPLRDALRPETRLVLLETPANPTLDVADVEAAAEVTDEAGVTLAVDNTFLTPVGQPVLDLGADVAVHSTTKYVEGHGTAVGGALVVREALDVLEEAQEVRRSAGNIQAPHDAWLTLRGLESLPLRLRRVSETAQRLAEVLETSPATETVRYPGLDSHPQRELAEAQHEVHGGILAFDLGSLEAARRFVDDLDWITPAEHLGTSRTLVTHPATMTHDDLSPGEREELGIPPGLLRLSVGLEGPDDLAADVERGLRRARKG